MIKNPKVDVYLAEPKKWREEVTKLRTVILDCQLTEELKWGKPCYTSQRSNIVVIISLKDCCALMFAKGALLKDTAGILLKPGQNTQAGRWIKFASLREIGEMEAILKAYIHEAVQVEKDGLEVIYKKTSEFIVPEEFQRELNAVPALKTAFEALTPGRQRGYLLYFSAPKQSKTRASRVAKYVPHILDGKGMND